MNNWKNDILKFANENNLKIYICKDSDAVCKEKFLANYRRKYDDDKSNFIIQYFSKYDLILIFKKVDHKEKTDYFTISKKKVQKGIDKNKSEIIKGIEFEWRKESIVYAATPSTIVNYFCNDLEKLMNLK